MLQVLAGKKICTDTGMHALILFHFHMLDTYRTVPVAESFMAYDTFQFQFHVTYKLCKDLLIQHHNLRIPFLKLQILFFTLRISSFKLRILFFIQEKRTTESEQNWFPQCQEKEAIRGGRT